MRLITELHNRHKDQVIWISGAGPSINDYPDDFLDDKLAMVLHNAYLKFPNAQYCHANELDRLEWFKENRPEYLDKTCTFAWPSYGRTQKQVEKVVEVDRDNYYWFILRPHSNRYLDEDFINQKVAGVKDGSQIDFGGYGSCLHAGMYCCIAMGVKQINIIGCEHTAKPDKPEYFEEAEEASKDLFKRNHVKLGKIQTPQTLALMKACEVNGIKVNRYMNYEEIEERN